MGKYDEPWHVLTMMCTSCCREFVPEKLTLHVKFCPDCEAKLGQSTPLAETLNETRRTANPPNSF